MAIQQIQPVLDNSYRDTMAPPNPNIFAARTAGMNKIGDALGQALMRRRQQTANQQAMLNLTAGLTGGGQNGNLPPPPAEGSQGGLPPLSAQGFLAAPTPAASPAVGGNGSYSPGPGGANMAPPQGGSFPVPTVIGNGQSQVASLGQSADPFSDTEGVTPLPAALMAAAEASSANPQGTRVASLDPSAGLGAMPPQGGGSAPQGGSGRALGLMSMIEQRGYSPQDAAAIVGNWTQESSLNPGSIGDRGTSGGMGQWHGPRFAQLENLAQSEGRNWQDPAVQVDMMDREMRSHPQWMADLENAQGTDAKTAVFMRDFESPAPATANFGHRDVAAHAALGEGGVQVAQNGPGLPYLPNANYSPGSIENGGATTPSYHIDPAQVARLSQIVSDPFVSPQIKEMALQRIGMLQSLQMPHPTTWATIPGTNDQRQIDWLGNPTGRIMQGGPMKYAAGDVVGGQSVGSEWSISVNPTTGEQFEVNKFTGQTRPVQGSGGNFPDLPGKAPAIGGSGPPVSQGGPSAPSPAPASPALPPAAQGIPMPSGGQGIGFPALGVGAAPPNGLPPGAPMGGSAAFNSGLPKQVMPALGGNPGGNTPTPPGVMPGVATGAPVAGNAPLQRGQFVLQPVEGETYLDNLAKAQPQYQGIIGEARAILRGDMPLPSGQSRAPNASQVIKLVYTANPNFSAPFAAARAQMVKSYNDSSTPNTPGGMILNADTALNHLGHLWQASEAFAPYQFNWPHAPHINAFLNALRDETPWGPDSDALSKYKSNLAPFVQELTKFYEGSGGTGADREEMAENLSPDAPPDARRSAMRQLAILLQGKLSNLQAKWHQGMGPNSPDYPMLSPDSQLALREIVTGPRQGGIRTYEPATAEDKAKIEEYGRTHPAPGSAPEMNEQQYNAAPSGTLYRMPGSSKVMRKP